MTARSLASKILKCFESGGKLLICGNGGSAAMSSHFAAELVSKFEHSRDALPALALTVDPAVITSIGNDFGFEKIFVRQLQALANPNDLLIVLSTSGKSKNCLAAIKWCESEGIDYIDWPREKGESTAIKQEYQLQLIHDVCRLIEKHYL